MIRDVEAHLRKEIKSSGRSFFAKHFQHKYTITRNIVTLTMEPELQEWINDWNFQVEEQQIKAERDGRNIWEGGPPYITDKTLAKKAAHHGIETILLDKFRVEAAMKKISKDFDIKVYKRGKYQVVIDLAKGMLNKVTKSKLSGKYVNIMNSATLDLYEKARSEAFNYIDIEQVTSPKTNKRERQGPDEDQALPGRTDTKYAKGRKNPLIRGHGTAKAVSGRLVESGGIQTTVAVLSVAKEWRKFVKGKIKTKVKNKQVLGMMGEVREEITDALSTRYSIHRFTKDSKHGGVKDETIIDLHATDAKGNYALASYDAKEMRKFVNLKATDIRNRLVKKFAHLQPDLTTSDTVRNRSQKLHNTILLESLLGVKGTRPDFRLKVNKKLLAESKKVLKATRGQKKGISYGANAGKKKQSAGRKLNTAVSFKQPGRRKKGKSIATAKTAESPIALRNLLNEMLPEMVASKMTSPALQFRTGRFANSARVENVNIGPRGGVGIDYTYMRDPYETFEPGNKQGSTQRDPRKIIGASIRELAMGIIGRQPTSLRRN